MADCGLGIAGLFFAAPGLIELFIRYGEWIGGRTQTFKNALDVWNDQRIFDRDLSMAKLNLHIDLACNVCASGMVDVDLKNALENQIERLTEEVPKAHLVLEKHKPVDVISRVRFALRGEREIRKIYKALEKQQNGLSQLLLLFNMKLHQIPRTALAREKLRLEDARYQSIAFVQCFIEERSTRLE